MELGFERHKEMLPEYDLTGGVSFIIVMTTNPKY